VFVHVSTAFANCDQKYITEEVFRPPVMPDRVMEAVDVLNDDVFALITEKMIHPRPNTYTYTKAIAEYLVFKESASLPCVIIRPSIVGCSWLEPYPGWIDNFNGATGLFQACHLGLLKTMIGKREASADLIPVDVVINMMIASAWFTGSKKAKNLYVFNCTSEKTNRCTWGLMEKMSNEFNQSHPSGNLLMTPSFTFSSYRWIKSVRCFVGQWIPAYMIDVMLKCCKKKP
jgi:fatty acyl-CoA reductase